MYQVFISYRRDGGDVMGKLLSDRLTEKGYKVFYDVESLHSGRFNDQLYEIIDECEDFVLVLPPNALDRCITDENDWVLQEIAEAIKMNKNIIPIFMRGFSGFPDNLPERIAQVKYMQGLSADNPMYYEAMIDQLSNRLLKSVPEARSNSNSSASNNTNTEEVEEFYRKMKHMKETLLRGNIRVQREPQALPEVLTEFGECIFDIIIFYQTNKRELIKYSELIEEWESAWNYFADLFKIKQKKGLLDRTDQMQLGMAMQNFNEKTSKVIDNI